MTTKPLSERLRDNPTSDIMTEAADRLDAQSEDYRDIYAEKAALEQVVAAQADSIRALMVERDTLEAECAVRARLNNMGSEHEAALFAQVCAASKTLREYAQQRDDLRKERDALREALTTIKEWPITSPLNMDAHNMQVVAHAALAQEQGGKE